MADGREDGQDKKLPVAFIEEMRGLFQKMPGVSLSELPAFLESMSKERSYGLRRNALKYAKEEFEESMPHTLKEVSWAEEGYFYEPKEQPGKSPFHEAGAYYIQEPSAMIAVELLDVKPGDFIADLCAAPGGKSTQIAGKMQGKGLLVCNEYIASRAEILAQNMERMGVKNCVILQEDTARLVNRFPLFFDKVLVDAPCSGEGMFRKEEQALLQWTPENVRMCSLRQQEILENAAKLVKPGGILVYSTCTFSEAEDEGVIRNFLEKHPEFLPDENVPSTDQLSMGICPGGLPGTLRMWPHKLQGEGHFAARLVKQGNIVKNNTGIEPDRKKEENAPVYLPEKRNRKTEKKKNKSSAQEEAGRIFTDFCNQFLCPEYMEELKDTGRLVWKKEKLFWMPKVLPEIDGLRAERIGLYIGEVKFGSELQAERAPHHVKHIALQTKHTIYRDTKKGRFEPSHTWAMTLKKEDVKQWKEVENPAAFLRGEAEVFPILSDVQSGEKETGKTKAPLTGWILMLWNGRPLGWGKASGNMIKNHYPKGLRR